MIQRLTMFLLLIFSYISNGQGIIEGQLAKKMISADFQKNFKDYQIFQLNPAEFQQKLNQRNTQNTIQFSIGHDFDWTIQLYENDILGNNYSIDAFTEEGRVKMPISKVKAYRGFTKKNEEVRLTIDKDFFYGYITQNGVKFFIEPAFYFDKTAPKDKFVIYSEKDVIQNKDNKCALIDAEENHISESQNLQERSSALTEGCAEVELAIASDYKMFQKYGSVAGVEAHNIGVMNNVQLNYDDEFEKEIKFKIVKQVVVACNGCDPWNGTRNPGQLLGDFRQWGNQGGFGNTSYDLAQFWTNRDFIRGIIGIAYLLNRGVMCTSLRYHAVQDFSSNSSLVRVVVAHELGHNFSAQHTSNGYIMNAFVNNTNRWAQSTINSVNRAVQSKVDNGCLTECTPILPPDLGDPDVPLSLDFIDASPETCFEAKDGAITLSVSGGFPDYSYFWNVNGLQGSKVENLSPGIYQCTIVDQNFAAVETGPIVIDGANSPLLVTVDDIKPQSCEGGFTGAINITADGGSPPYFYNWSNGYLEDDISQIDAGTYSVTVLDAYGCFTVLDHLVIPSGSTPLAEAEAIATINCNQQEVVLNGLASDNGTNNYYLWTTDDGNIVSGESTLTPTVNAPGTYTLTVFNGSDDCFSSTEVQVLEDNLQPSVDINDVGILNCNQTSLVLNALISNTTNVSTTWSTQDGNILSGAASQNPMIDQAGTYHLIVTNNDNGCQTEAEVTVSSNFTEPSVLIESDGNLDCNHASTTLTASVSDNTSYQWSTPDGQFIGNLSQESIDVDQEGTYLLTATHNESGCSSQATIVVTSNQEIPNISIDQIQNIDCNHPTVNVNAFANNNGNFVYEWTTSNGAILSAANSSNLSTNQAGDYTLLVTNTDTGCQAEKTITIDQAPDLVADFQNVMHNLCNGDENGQAHIQISSGTAPYSYQWSNGMDQATAQNLAAGDYQVIVTDAAGCSFEKTVTINQPTPLNLEISENSGQLTAMTSGGTSPYTYHWNTDETTATISASTPGTYTLEITDANGCIATQSFVISQPECNLSANITSKDATCFSMSDGTASVEIQGATGIISYLWSNELTTKNIENLKAGSYSVTATDENDCQIIEQVTIDQPSKLTASSTKTDALCHSDANGTATVSVIGGTAPYTYQWNNDSNNPSLENLTNGQYSCIITDSHNCTTTSSIEIEAPELLTIKPLVTAVSTPNGNDGSIIVGVNGGTPPYSFLWSNGETNPEITGLDKGNYSVDISDAHECTISMDFEITAPDVVLIDIEKKDIKCFGEDDGTATVNVTQGESPFTYLWSNNETTSSISTLSPGNYSVTVTDNLGITSTASVEITQPDNIEINILTHNVDCFGNTNGGAEITATGGTPPYEYKWQNDLEDNLPAGNYIITIVDANNCVATSKFIITSPDEIVVSETITDSKVNQAVGAIDITPTGGLSPYTFVWSNEAKTEDIDQLKAGVYSVTITDKNGCTYENTYTVGEIVATNELLTEENLSIHPNPSSGNFILEMDIRSQKSIQIDIFNVTGQKITADIQELSKNERYQVHLSPVAGVYFMKLRLDDEILVKKLVVE